MVQYPLRQFRLVNLVGVVPLGIVDSFYGVGAGVHFVDASLLENDPGLTDSETKLGANAQFGLDLYGELRTDAGNLFLSPLSISTALGMAACGGAPAMQFDGKWIEGTTKEDIDKVLAGELTYRPFDWPRSAGAASLPVTNSRCPTRS